MFSDATFLRFASVILGVLLLLSAVAQGRTGRTYGLTRKGRVDRDQEPGYFRMLLIGRTVLRSILVILGPFLP